MGIEENGLAEGGEGVPVIALAMKRHAEVVPRAGVGRGLVHGIEPKGFGGLPDGDAGDDAEGGEAEKGRRELLAGGQRGAEEQAGADPREIERLLGHGIELGNEGVGRKKREQRPTDRERGEWMGAAKVPRAGGEGDEERGSRARGKWSGSDGEIVVHGQRPWANPEGEHEWNCTGVHRERSER